MGLTGTMRSSVVLRAVLLALFLAPFLGSCDKQAPPELPPAEIYPEAVDISGAWSGEVGGDSGALTVEKLGTQHFRGLFEARGTGQRYVLNIEQVQATGPGGAPAPTNLVQFTWQDGHGDRGAGWLLVNREGSALTGTYGRGENNTDGAGTWTFVRPRDANDLRMRRG